MGDLTTVGPTLTVPLDGDYDFEMVADSTHAVNAAYIIRIGLKIGAAAVSADDEAQIAAGSGGGSTEGGTYGTLLRKTDLTAATVVKMQYANAWSAGATNASWAKRKLMMTPVRVSG